MDPLSGFVFKRVSRVRLNPHQASTIEMENLEEQHFGPVWFIPEGIDT